MFTTKVKASDILIKYCIKTNYFFSNFKEASIRDRSDLIDKGVGFELDFDFYISRFGLNIYRF